MTKEYDNTNRGGLWINKRKEKENHPDYTGSVNVGGVEFWLSAWKKYSPNNGEAFLSISVKEKEERPRQQPSGTDDFLGGPKPSKANTTPDLSDDGDDIPF